MQDPLPLTQRLHALRAPKDAPSRVVRQLTSARQAMRTTLRAFKVKQAALAAFLHKSEGYVSKVINEREPMPEWFAEAFCYVTGSNLLRQYLALTDALEDRSESEAWQTRRLANQLREAA